jgi:hypothetical protein
MSFVVVSFCMDSAALEHALAAVSLPDPQAFPHRAVRVAKQAEALGGKLCAFGPKMIAFAFQDADIEEAVALAARVVTRDEPGWMAGMSQGDLVGIQEASSFSSLSWGRPLVVSAALAEKARSGGVLIDPEIPGIAEVVRSHGVRWVSGGTQAISAISLDVEHPLLRDAVDPYESDDRVSESGPPVTMEAAQAADLARQALIQGDIELLDHALAQLKPTGAHPALVERLAGLLALNRGAKHEGLRTLRQAAESESRPAVRTRARLAYAIALASAERPETALLEALSALSLARASEDKQGEQACARLLSQLSSATGHVEAASAWEHIAAIASGIVPDQSIEALPDLSGDAASDLEPPDERPLSLLPDDLIEDESSPSETPQVLTLDSPDDVDSELDATYVPDGRSDLPPRR